MPVKKSQYRQPMTPEGIKAIEEGTLDYFDTAVWGNLNTGALEQYLEEKSRTESFTRSKFLWKRVALGLAIGILFTMINQYLGLKVGIIVPGGWYLTYLVGLVMKWPATEVNITSGASTGASQTSTGFAFIFPSLYLLARNPDYAIGSDASGEPIYLISESMLPHFSFVTLAVILAGLLGVMYFTIFRRIWLIEDPLPVPGFQAGLKLMDIAHDRESGSSDYGKKSAKSVIIVALVTMIFTFLKDFPIAGKAILDRILGGLLGSQIYGHGEFRWPGIKHTNLSFEIIPFQFAIGWFMKFRTAFFMTAGTLLTWFVIVPMAVGLHVPIYIPTLGASFDVFAFSNAPDMAFKNVGRVIAIGAILGGGITALLKMAPVFKTAMKDVMAVGKADAERTDFVPGKGWYEWPMTHIPIVAAISSVGVLLLFLIFGFPVVPSVIFSILIVVLIFMMGAIGVKVMGETGTTPVSGTSFIVFIILISILMALGVPVQTMALMALLGATIFGSALSLCSDIISDFKLGTYTGTRPFHLVKAQIIGIPLGAPFAAFIAIIFSLGLTTYVNGQPLLNLQAPQANAYATFVLMVLGPNPPWDIFIIGILIGIIAELTTGLGTAIGLGMYLPLGVTLPLLVGGIARDYWERTRFEPRAKAEKWDEKKRAKVLMRTYLIGCGLIIGEALMGTVIALYMVLSSLVG